MRVWFLLFLSATVLISAVVAIICFDCDSLSDPHCSDNFDPKGITQANCSDIEAPENQINGKRKPGTGCVTKFHENPTNPDRYFIRRGCFFGNSTNTTDTQCNQPDSVLPLPKILACEVCDKDLCNAGGGNGTVAI